MNAIRNISEKTIPTALVNYKFVGMFGKCMAHLNGKERDYVIDELTRRGYIDNNMNILPSAKDVILQNLDLFQYKN